MVGFTPTLQPTWVSSLLTMYPVSYQEWIRPLAKFSKSRLFLVKYYQEEFQNRPCGKTLKKILVLWLYNRFTNMFIRISNRSFCCWWNSLHPTGSQSSHMFNKSHPFLLTKDTNAKGLPFLSCIFTFNFTIHIIQR